MKVRTYKLLDIAALTAAACVLEAINILALKRYFDGTLFSLSILIPMCALVLVRWRYPVAATALLAGVVYCVCLNGDLKQLLIYGVGNLFVLLNLLWFLGGRRVEKSWILSLALVLTVYLSLQLGRATMAAAVGYDFVQSLVGFLTTDSLNLVMGVIITVIAKRQKNFFVYQPDYLIAVAKEREAEMEKRDRESKKIF